MAKLRVGNPAMIRYFNPGHESAVLNASKYYRPPANQVLMQNELAYLPAWYAQADDSVFVENPLPNDFLTDIQAFPTLAKAVVSSELTTLSSQTVDLWGISPQSVYFFEKLKQTHSLDWQIPEWKEIYRKLGSREAAQPVLSELIRIIPEIESDILPRRFSDIDTLEKELIQNHGQQIVKSPYSSSGRGLVWLPSEKIARSERQIISGMLNKQGSVSVEKALDKRLDFSMHFEISAGGKTEFIGYSVFQTNPKGVYERSLLASQEVLEKMIINRIDFSLLQQVKTELIQQIEKNYAPHYVGCIGVDMLVYFSENKYKLNPCVEINMRKSMGYLAIRLTEQFLHLETHGSFFVNYHSASAETFQIHQTLKKHYPLIVKNNRIVSGYFNLCPVSEDTHYQAYLMLNLLH
ncbi:hypothetical protein AGMMS50262_17920 [Bacteroidia bacterium]|nr:hypothetical protein AGMMS50262_17920 [Bacteroidia bacterium]